MHQITTTQLHKEHLYSKQKILLDPEFSSQPEKKEDLHLGLQQ